MIKLTAIIVCFLIVLSNKLQAQSDIREGFVVTAMNDTLNGYIIYQPGKRYESCLFSIEKMQKPYSYFPDQIKAYGLVDYKYFEKRFHPEKQKLEFFEVIVKGLVSLLKNSGFYYIESADKKLYKLTNPKEKIIFEEKEIERQSREYIALLTILLADCPEYQRRIQDIEIYEKQLAQLIIDYNKCKNSKFTIYKTHQKWMKVMGGMLVGINNANSSFEANKNFDHMNNPFSDSKSTFPGLFFEIGSPRINDRLSFQLAITYLNSTNRSYKYNTYGLKEEFNYISISKKEIFIPFGISYRIPFRYFDTYLNLGPSVRSNVNFSYEWIQEIKVENTIKTYKKDDLELTKNYIGSWIGAGIQKKLSPKAIIFFESKFEKSSYLINNAPYPHKNVYATNYLLLFTIGLKSN